MNQNFICLIVCFFLSSHHLFSQGNDLDRYLDHLYQHKKMMGGVSVSHQDTLIYSHFWGLSDVKQKKKIDQNTKFRIASLTKTYTATLILMAIEEGKLTLDTSLSPFFPEIKNAKNITIEHLLRHQSGIFNFTEIENGTAWEQKPHSKKEIITYIQNTPSNFIPGSEFEYSNSNYTLLGYILENLYQQSYATLLQEKISKPLSLPNTYFSMHSAPKKQEALSYNIQDEYIQNAQVNFYNHQSGGGLVSTPDEVNQFLTALFNEKLISKESLQKMLPQKNNEYGLGIMKLYFQNPEGYMHAGRIENYFSEYWYFPKEKLGIVTMANATNIDLDEVQTTILKFMYGMPIDIPEFNATTELTPQEYAEISGTYREKNKKFTITISSNGKELVFQNSNAGQMFIPLIKKTKNTYFYENMELLFFPEKSEILLKQNGIEENYIKIPKQPKREI